MISIVSLTCAQLGEIKWETKKCIFKFGQHPLTYVRIGGKVVSKCESRNCITIRDGTLEATLHDIRGKMVQLGDFVIAVVTLGRETPTLYTHNIELCSEESFECHKQEANWQLGQLDSLRKPG